MKGKKYSEEQIIGVLKELRSGISIQDLCRKHGVTDATIYNWKKKFGDMEVSDARRLKQLEEENRKLKRVVADLTLDNLALKDINSKKW